MSLAPPVRAVEAMTESPPTLSARPNPNLTHLVSAMAAKQEVAMGELFDLTRLAECVFDGGWRTTGLPGIDFKPLYQDKKSGMFTRLLRMEPGARYPPHAL